MSDTESYYAARAREERQRALASGDPAVAKIHDEMASEYENRLQDTEAFEPREQRA